jgi:hypothetical protein
MGPIIKNFNTSLRKATLHGVPTLGVYSSFTASSSSVGFEKKKKDFSG